MEPVAYAAHRWVMHGPGWGLHRSHHLPPAGALEANDVFPAVFASATMAAIAVGMAKPAVRTLVPLGVGVTAYGAAYAFVHDVVVHRRAGAVPAWGLRRQAAAHARHHLYGGEPYGMLWARHGASGTATLDQLVRRGGPPKTS
jgi:beta-carotene 3-hydroxylase